MLLVSALIPGQGPLQSLSLGKSPRPIASKVVWVVVDEVENATITAYPPDPRYTDNTPFIAKWGDRVFLGMVANNCLKRGTVVEIFGWRYRVLDRMAQRHGCERFDIWLPSVKEANQFGIKRGVTVKTLKQVPQ